MPLVLGIDEAGYGPTLGPLLVCASLWRVEPKHTGCDFWEALADSVVKEPKRTLNERLSMVPPNVNCLKLDNRLVCLVVVSLLVCGCRS